MSSISTSICLLLALFVAAYPAGEMVAADSSRESTAIVAIRKAGGSIERDESVPGNPVVGVTFFDRYRSSASKFGDADLHLLAEFPQLRRLDLLQTQVTNEGLADLEELRQLAELDLYGTKISSTGLAALAGLPHLTHLHAFFSELTDADLRQLTSAKNLTDLALVDTDDITDAGFASLGILKNLERLDLSGTKVACKQEQLKNLQKLTYLRLSRTPIDDESLNEISRLQNLVELDLSDCSISDQNLSALARLPRLSRLNLSQTKVTDFGIQELGNLRNLSSLSLESTAITDRGLRAGPAHEIEIPRPVPNVRIGRPLERACTFDKSHRAVVGGHARCRCFDSHRADQIDQTRSEVHKSYGRGAAEFPI